MSNNKKRKRLPIDMRTLGRKKKKGKAKIDYLTNLPTNILFRILSNVTMPSFLDLSQTNSQLRWFMQAYAPTICNLSILTRFPSEAKILQAREIAGWLTPTGSLLGIKPRKEARWVVPGMQLQLYEPGPHFLYFLEKKVTKFMSVQALMVEWEAMQRFMDELNGESPVVYGGRDYPQWIWLRQMVWYHGVPS